MNYKLFLILKLDWINSDVQLRMLMFLTLLLLLDLHQITMIICCMWCSVYYLFCLTKRMAVHSVSLLQLCWDCSMLISIENRFKWNECLLLRQGIYGPLFTCPLSRLAGLCVTQQWWHRSATAGEKSLFTLANGDASNGHLRDMRVSVHMCVCENGNAKVNACEVNISFTPSVCIYSVKKKGGDVTPRESQSHISCLDLCQAFWLVRL